MRLGFLGPQPFLVEAIPYPLTLVSVASFRLSKDHVCLIIIAIALAV